MYACMSLMHRWAFARRSFFSELETRWSDSSQTSNQAFLAMFSVISQLKNTIAGLIGSQLGNANLIVLKVRVTHTYNKKKT